MRLPDKNALPLTMPNSLRPLVAGVAALAAAAPAPAQPPAPPAPPAPEARCWLAWDANYLYAAIRFDDADLEGTVKAISPRSYPAILQDDGVALSVRAGDGAPCTMLVSTAGGFAFVRDGMAIPIFSIKYGVSLQGTLGKPGDSDRGATIELAIPWQALGVDSAKVSAGAAPLRACVSLRQRGISAPFAFPAGALPDDPMTWAPLPTAGADGFVTRPANPAPTIDGTIAASEWAGTPFHFAIGAGTAPEVAPTAPITTPVVVFDPADAKSPTLPLAAPVAGLERRLFARFLLGLNADVLKPSSPTRGILGSDGGIRLIDQPAQALGPWYSPDRIGYHRGELGGMARAGIDTALTVVGSIDSPGAPLDAKALTTLAAARKELDRERLPAPDLALELDTMSFVAPPDLSTLAGREALYRSIARWFELVPPEQRATVRLPADTPSGTALAYPVFLSAAAGLVHADDPEWVQALRDRFAAEFGPSSRGITLVFVGGPGFDAAKAKLAATIPAGVGAGTGPVKTFLVQPGSQSPFVARRFGEAYRTNWEAARAAAADWIVLDSWNDFARATEVAPSRQYGDGYVGLTKLATVGAPAADAPEFAVRFGAVQAPRRLRPSQLVTLKVGLRNAGAKPLLPEPPFALSYRWIQDGKTVYENPLKISLRNAIAPGQAASLRLGVATVAEGAKPLAPGAYLLELVASFPNGSQTLRLPVEITAGDSVEFAGTTLSPLLRVDTNYPVAARLRWLGAEPLLPGAAQLVWQALSADGASVVASGATPIDSPISPGAWVSVPAQVRLSDTSGQPLEPAFPERQAEANSESKKWGYRIRWSLQRTDGGPALGGYEERIALYPGTDEARVSLTTPPASPLEADQAITIPVLIANTGTTAWPKGRIALTGRWFQADGFPVPVVTALPNTTLDRPVAPGEAVLVDVVVRTPERPGRFVLGVFALRPPDVFLSLHPVTRTGDTAFFPVDVRGGRLTPLDLTSLFDIDAVAWETKPGDGSFDDEGGTLPGEWFPADKHGLNRGALLMPSAYFTDLASEIVRGTAFRYGPVDDGKKNALRCAGQKLPAPKGTFVALHLAAAAIGGKEQELTVTVRYKDGKTETLTRKVRDWRAAPRSDEALALRLPRRRTAAADQPEPAALQHIVFPIKAASPIAEIQLPRTPQIRIFAATLER